MTIPIPLPNIDPPASLLQRDHIKLEDLARVESVEMSGLELLTIASALTFMLHGGGVQEDRRVILEGLRERVVLLYANLASRS